MRQVPARIATPESAVDVTAEVRRLLLAAGVKDQLPTPKAEILECRKLVEAGELDLAEYKTGLFDKTLSFFHTAVSKVRGLLDRRSEIIYVDGQLHESRKLFVTYHEVVHSILPWQRIILTQDDDISLSHECEDVFEAEANYGAADILFQCDRFEREAKDYELSLTTALHLSDQYGASYHATIRRFVERNHRPCCLLVLKPTMRDHPDGRRSYFVVYSIPSGAFRAEFGEQFGNPFISPKDHLGEIANRRADGEMVLFDMKGFPKNCVVEYFTNGYTEFVLVYPRQVGLPRKIVRLASDLSPGRPTLSPAGSTVEQFDRLGAVRKPEVR